MFIEMMNKINKFFNEPLNEPLRKSPEMVKAKTEAQILKAEEDFKTPRIRTAAKSPRGSLRLVPRYPEEDQFLAHGHSHTGHGPVWDTRPIDIPNRPSKKQKPKKRK